MQRAREVGMRKVLGAVRSQLVFQFLGESLLFVFLALLIALIAVRIGIDYNLISLLLGEELILGNSFDSQMLWWIVGLTAVIGLLSGLYPAFYLSSISPVLALSSNSKSGKTGSGTLRQILVLVQFTISMFIISSTLLMANQMTFVSNMSLGFSKENKLLVPLLGADVIERIPTLRNELAANPNILDISTTQSVPGGVISPLGMQVESDSGPMEMTFVSLMQVGEDFLQSMDIPVSQGRDFSKKFLTDVGRSYVVNETLYRQMNWQQPLGKRISLTGGMLDGRVIGVVEDFHFASLYESVTPLVIMTVRNNFEGQSRAARAQATQTLILNISADNIPDTLSFVGSVMNEFDPLHPFEFEFLDDQLDQLYDSEQSIMNMTVRFAALCIFISCLGLFGLASFTTEQRTKEIGIRKVLGASSVQIILLLTRSILVLIFIGSIISSIVSWFTIDQWLRNFAYSDAINPLIFLLGTILVIVVALITVILQSLSTIRANPVTALHYE